MENNSKPKLKLAPRGSLLGETIRTVSFDEVVKKVTECCLNAAFNLPSDVLSALKEAAVKEQSELGRDFIEQYLKNAQIAKESHLPLCQDTGFAVYFVEMGDMVRLDHGTIYEAITQGTANGYKLGYLRKSIVTDPIFARRNTTDNTPAIIHLDIVPGDRISVILAPKGGGSENMSALRMLKPSEGRQGVVDFVVDTVVRAGGNPCPPTIVGVGVGGTFEKAAFLAKKALLRKVGTHNDNPEYAAMEADILSRINASGVGPQGLGGTVTALAVHVDYFPCHIASMPVAVNLNCHAARHSGFEI